jgi:GNAT superfamily N-acetyltransferase
VVVQAGVAAAAAQDESDVADFGEQVPAVEAAAFVHHERRRGDVDGRQGDVDHSGDPGPDRGSRGAGVFEEGVDFCAWEDDRLVGFVNVAWDGGVHAFVLDTVVAQRNRANRVGAALVRTATEGCRAAGCEWLHVDSEEHLRSFYFDACGFRETAAGLIAL